MNEGLIVGRSLGMIALGFLISAALMPGLIRLLHRLGMKKSIRDEASAPVMAALHAKKAGTPNMGGIIIWGTTLIIALILGWGCVLAGEASTWCKISFLSRGQTWLPLGLMVAAALIGLVDDYWNVKRMGPRGGGLKKRHQLISYLLIGLLGAWWFYTKLDWHIVHVPFLGTFDIGWWYMPFFILTIVSTSFSVNEIDGLDGLAGGTLLAAFGAYAIIAWSLGRTDLATLCAAIIGALLGFLWFNVNPADVFMGDTGAMSIGTVLGVVALMTNQPFLLIIIGLPFVIESLSVLIQNISKLLRHGKKIFKSSPLHHHLEAIGWSEPRIVMRFWMISFVCAGIGVVLALLDH